MSMLSHPRVRLSMCLLIGVGALTLASPASSNAAPTASSPFYGRWTVADEHPVFTARGLLYKIIDVAPCGNDFCGVSVSDKGQCGATLFHFLSIHANDGTTILQGHGKWGDKKKNIQIYNEEDPNNVGERIVTLYLGDGLDFGDRSGNMPTFNATYRRLGEAECSSR